MRVMRFVLSGGVFFLLWAAPLLAANLSSAVGGLSAAGKESNTMPEGVGVSPDSTFGETWSYIHPFLSLGEYYTDNLFNTNRNEEGDFVTVITPGVWLALPASRQMLTDVETTNTAPGGFEVTRFDTKWPRRVQAYALYRANINRHNDFAKENTVNHRGEGRLQYNLRGGLSFELLDIYKVEQDPYATGVSQNLDEFKSNVFNLMAVYRMSPKTRVRADYNWYSLSYDAFRNQFRDRDDKGISLYAFHQVLEKTSVFLQYEYINIDYDRDFLVDSREQHYFAGLIWDASEKTRVEGKLGYGVKSFKGPVNSFSDNRDLIGEARLDYSFTPKTAMSLRATRTINETDILGLSDVLTHRVGVAYSQRITAKVRALADVEYLRNAYRGGDLTVGLLRGERTDEYLGAGISLGFSLRDWLNLSVGYKHTDRNSNFNVYDYKANTYFVTLTAAI